MATMRSLLPPRFHYYIYIFALLLLALGLPLSKYLMSLSQLILLGNWILEGDLKTKFTNFWKNKPAFILSSLLILHFIGMLYTTDMNYAMNDIRIKLPLLALPLIISTSRPFSGKIFDALMYVFVSATFIATMTSNLILADIIHKEIVDTRNISIFIDHIRFGLLICVAIFISGYYAFREHRISARIVWILAIAWFIIFLVRMESLTGLAVLGLTFFVLATYKLIISQNKLIRLAGAIGVCVSLLICTFYLRSISEEHKPREKVDMSKLEERTKRGTLYRHDTASTQTENGYYVWIYRCEEELAEVWNKRSQIPFLGHDMKGNEIQYTIIRFLASKGLRKDYEGAEMLSDEEVKAIERGVSNVNYQDMSSLKGRLHETFWEIEKYRTSGDPNGNSLAQRYEYWKTALHIIAQYPLFGVGTGDVQLAFDEQYVKDNSPLYADLRFHSHNQYLTITVAFGVFGLIWFVLTLFYPMYKQKKIFDYLYITFFIVTMISFLNEDTLETQAGVTFYVFFNTVFLFANRKEDVPAPAQREAGSLLFGNLK